MNRVVDGPWPLRLVWVLLPVLAGPALGDALDDASRPVQVVAAVGLWAGWAAVLAAALVPRTASLTIVRLAAPAPLAAAAAAAVAGPFGADDALALAAGVAVAGAVLLPATADAFVDGSSYGAERRFALRSPAVLLAGAAPLAWLMAVAAPAAAALLLAAGAWVAGAVAAVVAAAGIALAVPAIHRLSRRWLVFVPAGLVVHDHFVLADPVLLRRPGLAAVTLGPDRTVELALDRPTELVFAEGAGRDRRAVSSVVERLVVAPVRPGAVLAEAAARRYPVATAEPTTSSPA